MYSCLGGGGYHIHWELIVVQPHSTVVLLGSRLKQLLSKLQWRTSFILSNFMYSYTCTHLNRVRWQGLKGIACCSLSPWSPWALHLFSGQQPHQFSQIPPQSLSSVSGITWRWAGVDGALVPVKQWAPTIWDNDSWCGLMVEFCWYLILLTVLHEFEWKICDVYILYNECMYCLEGGVDGNPCGEWWLPLHVQEAEPSPILYIVIKMTSIVHMNGIFIMPLPWWMDCWCLATSRNY